MGIFSGFGSTISDIGDNLFGNGQKAGVFDTGKETYNPYQIDPNAALTQNGYALGNEAQQQFNGINTRQAPQVGNIQIAPNQQVAQTQIAPVTNAQSANLGPASTMNAARINTGADNQDRSMQNQLNGQLALQASGQGPSLAALQEKQATDRANSQAMGMAAAMPGQGNSALAARNAINAASQNDQAAAAASEQGRIQEQLNAQQQLAGNLSGERSADQGLATNQAQLQQGANESNQGAVNNFALANNANQQAVNLTNAGAANNQALNQAQLTNTINTTNAGNQNNLNLNQAQLQANIAQGNQGAYLNNQAQNDNAAQYYYGSQVGMDQANRAAALQMQQMQANQNMGVMGLDTGAYQAAGKAQANLVSGAANGAASALGAVSDENAKTDIKPLSSSELDEIYGPLGQSSSSAPAAAADKTKSTNPFAGKQPTGGGGSGGMSGLLGGATNSMGQNVGNFLSASPLGQVLSRGQSPVAQATAGTGDYVMSGGGLNVGATGNAINQSTVVQPTLHPGATAPMGGGMHLGPISISDRNQKDQVVTIDATANNDLKKLPAYEYEYKNPDMPGAGQGKHVSPMAQDLEDTKLFGGSVSTGPDGIKRVDYAKAFGGMLASMAMLNRKVDSMKGGR